MQTHGSAGVVDDCTKYTKQKIKKHATRSRDMAKHSKIIQDQLQKIVQNLIYFFMLFRTTFVVVHGLHLPTAAAS